MNKMKMNKLSCAVVAALMGGLVTSQAQALSFESSDGEVQGRLDTTVSYGVSYRIEDRDNDLIGKANLDPLIFTRPLPEQIAAPGRFSVNSDDGNLNYDDGDLISNAIKITSELELTWRNFGAFFRASGFYDFENEDKDELTEIAKEFVGSDVTLLDAFIWGDFEFGDSYMTTRFGRQVVNWGESTFLQGGMNVINPVDVSKLRVAGAELKEALLPQDMIWTSIDLSQNLSLEALYIFEFEQIDPDPAGTYFSTNDFGTPGGEFVMLGFGLFPELTPAVTISREPDRYADEGGQYGLALRYFADWLGTGTDFGFYYLNYHSRLPLISGTSVTSQDLFSGEYFIEYPEDIELFGASFNTTIGSTGWSWQGEIAYRDNLPLQIDDVEVLFAALSPLNALIPQPVNRFTSQLGDQLPGTYVRGWERHEVTNASTTFTRAFSPGNPIVNFAGADQWIVLTELGATKVWDLPDPSVLRYQGPGTDTGGGASAVTGGNFRNPVTEDSDRFATSFSWGYRFVTRMDYNSAFGTAVNLFPRLAFNHDVSGTSPGPGGSFVEDRKALTFGLGATYLEKWGFDLSYTRYFGAGRYNLIGDRDFVSVLARYSF